MKKILEIEKVSFCYKVKPILKDVNLSVEEGDFLGIIGPNGGGKTTLLKLIIGIYAPHTGRIRVFGKEPREVREKFGYVPQAYNIDKQFPITVLEFVLLGMLTKSHFGFFKKDQKEKAIQILEKMGLKNFVHSPFGSLSGGETQKALIARALISDPEILILDEPTANIDPESEKTIFDILTEINKTTTILMVSHDLQTIISRVKKVITVQCSVNTLLPSEVCEHFALGLYHSPIIRKKND
ncbi:MAG: ABC transporter ATP-binding protein [Parachlamydiales bacterium]